MPDVHWPGQILATVTWLDVLKVPVLILSRVVREAQVKEGYVPVATVRHLGLGHTDAVTSGKWQVRCHSGFASPVASWKVLICGFKSLRFSRNLDPHPTTLSSQSWERQLLSSVAVFKGNLGFKPQKDSYLVVD